MSIRVQVGKPTNNGEFCYDDKKLSEAIETIFPMMTEEAFLIWNTYYIPLNYKYDISCMIDDLLKLLKTLREQPCGKLKIVWPSDTFASEWFISWDEENIKINSKWTSVLGHIEELLNRAQEITMEKYLFQCEWKKLLETLICNLKKCNYNTNKLIDFKDIITEYNFIKEFGVLYQDDFGIS